MSLSVAKITTENVEVAAPMRSRSHPLVLGIDGGGTKTHAVIIDSAAHVISEGTAGPSNPLRVGVGSAAGAIREAIDEACHAAGVERAELASAEIGLAGVRRDELKIRMREALAGLGIRPLEVVSDADIALYGATGGAPGLVVIAGTGSKCCGVNGQRKRSCSGGWGPIAGDEGSGSWIARRALQSIAHASDGRGPQTALVAAARAYFAVARIDDLSTAIYSSSMTNDRIAGFCSRVIDVARSGDAVSRSILADAGTELGHAAVAVIKNLRMESERFQAALVGGVFAAGDLVVDSLRERISAVAPHAYLAPPKWSPAIAAARLARQHVNQLAVAV